MRLRVRLKSHIFAFNSLIQNVLLKAKVCNDSKPESHNQTFISNFASHAYGKTSISHLIQATFESL